jgi:NAD(P)-dependent dehydrogenase (short-subunit alcohol dehydrogenase family)
MIAIRGAGSKIACELLPLISDAVEAIPRDRDMPVSADRHLFCAGLLRAKSPDQMTRAEIEESYAVNLWRVTDDCERIFSANERARVCVIGSESAYRGSYDGVYADAKRVLHRYVEQKRLRPGQQLVCISPTVIEDAGQCVRRLDQWRVDERRAAHPKGRLLKAAEVARLVHFLLYQDAGFITGVVIRMNGGEHTL